jgi:glycosyltransferase involved in cell wall biosynthesis
MNILHACSSLSVNSGGPSRSVTSIARELELQGAGVFLGRLKGTVADEVELPRDVSAVSLVGNEFVCDKTTQPISLGENIELIHSHGLWLPFNHKMSLIARREELLHVVAPRGMLEPWALNNSKWKKKLAWTLYQKRDLQRATAFHATAHSEAESIRRLGFKQPIAVIPNGVVLPKLKADNLKTGNRVKTALFLSRIHPKKGLPMLLDAWKQLTPKGWRLVIAGNDDSNHLPELERQIAELGLSDQVEIVGPLFGADKEQAYLNADLFVLPSYSENFGIVIAEALSYQVPVLTTTGCPWEQLEAERCGWSVEPTVTGVERGLRDALCVADEELAEMGKRGRALIEAEYLWPEMALKMMQFYKWLLGEGGRPACVITE